MQTVNHVVPQRFRSTDTPPQSLYRFLHAAQIPMFHFETSPGTKKPTNAITLVSHNLYRPGANRPAYMPFCLGFNPSSVKYACSIPPPFFHHGVNRVLA